MRGAVKRERIANGSNVAVEPQRALERATRGIDTTKTQLEDARALDVDPCSEVWLRGIRVGHASEMRDEVLPTIFVGGRNAFALVRAFFDEDAAREIGLEAFERRGMMRGAPEHELPRFAGIVLSISSDEQTCALDEQLDRGSFTRRDGDLSLEVTQHRDELRSMMEATSEDRVRWREIRIDLERGFDLGVHARVVCERLVHDRELDVHARKTNAILGVRQALDTRGE
jgi:hypothetical protein